MATFEAQKLLHKAGCFLRLCNIQHNTKALQAYIAPLQL